MCGGLRKRLQKEGAGGVKALKQDLASWLKQSRKLVRLNNKREWRSNKKAQRGSRKQHGLKPRRGLREFTLYSERKWEPVEGFKHGDGHNLTQLPAG